MIPGVSLELTNTATGVKFTANTNNLGQYRFNNLAAGAYDLVVSRTGFTSSNIRNLTVALNATVTRNVTLQVGSVTQSVEVSETSAMIDTTTTQLQSVFQSDLSTNLPAAANFVNDTGVLNLSLLAPGVTQSGGVGYGTGPSVGGQRPTNNSFNIDGVDNNRRDVTGPTSSVPNDAVAEFSLLQNQFSPEFGGASGGIFNTIVKSGTNQIHGSIYEYFANRNLNALDSKQAVQGFTSPPRFDYNRLGATIGGPIIRNKLFYFGDYEYSPLGQASVPGAPILSPTQSGYSMLQGLNGVSKTNLGILQQYLPAAGTATDTITVGGTTIPVGQIPISGPSYTDRQNVVVAVDYNMSPQDQIRGRYVYNKYTSVDINAQLPAFYTTYPDNRHLMSISEFHTFSPSLINEFRASYSRKNNSYPVGDFKFPGLDQFPNLTFDDIGLQLGPDSSSPQGYVQGTLQGTDNITKTWSRHTLKAGYQFVDVIGSNNFIQRARGDYEYSALDLYLRDLSPDVLGERSVGISGGIPVGYLFHSVYLNDDFKLRRNLTLNLGIRYEYMTVPVVSRYQSYSAPASVPGLISFAEPKSDHNNWSPRVGIAWSPGKNGEWAIRAGFGLNYDQTYNNLNINEKAAYFQLTEDVPDLSNNTPRFLAQGGLPPSNTINLPTDPAGARAAITSYTFDQVRPYSINYTLGIQRTLHNDYILEARYVGTKGVHLYVQDQLNRVSPVTASQNIPTFFSQPTAQQLAGLSLTLGGLQQALVNMTHYPASPSNAWGQYGFTGGTITSYHPIGNSEYNGLSLQLNKRYARNFSYLTSFTWSHVLDDSTATVYSTVLTPRRGQDFRNTRPEWATSALDRRMRFTFTPMYDVKLGHDGGGLSGWMMRNVVGNWNIAATYSFQSPAYTTVQSGIDSNLNADSAGDRSVINPAGDGMRSSGVIPIGRDGGTLASGNANIVAYVARDPGARYVQAGLGALANSGRNTFPMHRTNNVDFQLLKRFAYGENRRVEIGAQLLNILNHPQWTGDLLNDVFPNANNNTRVFLLTGNSSFGRFDQFFTSNPRSMSLVARIIF